MRPFAILLTAAALTTGSLAAAPALAQETEEEKVVFARQILMTEAASQMAPLDLAAVGEEVDIGAAQPRASAISAMMGVTPYLFPDGTDMESMADADFTTIALPAIWESPDAFAAMAQRASDLAFDLSTTSDAAAFAEKAAELRSICDACHAAYMQPYESPF